MAEQQSDKKVSDLYDVVLGALKTWKNQLSPGAEVPEDDIRSDVEEAVNTFLGVEDSESEEDDETEGSTAA